MRDLIEQLREQGELAVVEKPVDRTLEMARVIRAMGNRAVLFKDVRDARMSAASGVPVVANLCARRSYLAQALDVPVDRLLFVLAEALRNPVKPPIVGRALCQQVIEPHVDLDGLPILMHQARDGGPYVTAGILITRDPELGINMAIHRLMQLDRRRFAARLVENRGTHTAWTKTDESLPVAICIGLPLHVLLAAAMSPAKGVNELHLAQALAPTPLVRCHSNDLFVPADAEWVLEGWLTHEMTAEGPFIDLTETYDVIRLQPVIEIEAITHRRNAIYQALLPGLAEHKLLMGLPREPTIYAAVNQVCNCLNVCLTGGGMNWLHAVVPIDKQRADDGLRAATAAFEGHSSLKHVVVVDVDVDPFDVAQVEWAIATRFQADQDLLIFENQPSSSLDPSALHVPGQKARTAKIGLDATIPWTIRDGRERTLEERAGFMRVGYDEIDLSDYWEPEA